jgi:hypothetical protein
MKRANEHAKGGIDVSDSNGASMLASKGIQTMSDAKNSEKSLLISKKAIQLGYASDSLHETG